MGPCPLACCSSLSPFAPGSLRAPCMPPCPARLLPPAQAPCQSLPTPSLTRSALPSHTRARPPSGPPARPVPPLGPFPGRPAARRRRTTTKKMGQAPPAALGGVVRRRRRAAPGQAASTANNQPMQPTIQRNTSAVQGSPCPWNLVGRSCVDQACMRCCQRDECNKGTTSTADTVCCPAPTACMRADT